MKTFKPKAFIKATEKTSQYECIICNYIADKPCVCRGPCKQNFCSQCVHCIKLNKNECPYKCSKPFEVVQGKEIELQFHCPFNQKECEELIFSLAEFYGHAEKCQFVPEGWKEKEWNVLKYKCDLGHDLFFLDEDDLRSLYGWNFYQMPTNSTCSSCSEKGLCRSICPQCSKQDSHMLYCTSCRKPPCTRLTCLYEHELQKRSHNNSPGLICDFCGTAAYLLGPHAYRDIACNFDICEACYINLPEFHELVPFKMQKSSISHLKKQHQPFNPYNIYNLNNLNNLHANMIMGSDEEEEEEEEEGGLNINVINNMNNVNVNMIMHSDEEEEQSEQMQGIVPQLEEAEEIEEIYDVEADHQQQYDEILGLDEDYDEDQYQF